MYSDQIQMKYFNSPNVLDRNENIVLFKKKKKCRFVTMSIYVLLYMCGLCVNNIGDIFGDIFGDIYTLIPTEISKQSKISSLWPLIQSFPLYLTNLITFGCYRYKISASKFSISSAPPFHLCRKTFLM